MWERKKEEQEEEQAKIRVEVDTIQKNNEINEKNYKNEHMGKTEERRDTRHGLLRCAR